jgi:tripeptidyl-peptidase-1
MRQSLLFACVITAITFACVSASVTRKEDWSPIGKASGDEQHTVAFVVKTNTGSQQRGDLLLQEINTPGSSQYLQYLSVDDVQQIFVNRTAVKKVVDFLLSNDLSFSTKSNFIWVTASTSKLNGLLNAEFWLYSHDNVLHHIPRTSHYTIPAEISAEVDAILQTTDFPAAHPRSINKRSAGSQHSKRDGADPVVLRSLYQVPNVRVNNARVSQGVLGGYGGFFKTDLTAFFTAFTSTASAADAYVVNTTKYDENICHNQDCGEQALDMQYSMAMAPGIKTYFFYSHGDGIAESINWLATEKSVPQTFSTSLSIGTTDSYATSLCSLVQQAALRGVTYLSASGDGAGFSSNCKIYDSDFPTACPYVTAVGGTQGPESKKPEQVWTASGAGAAAAWPMPAWQVNVAKNYFTVVGNALPTFNRNARLWPDVAAVASYLPLYFRGTLSYAGGTSFASPTFTGILSQINAHRDSIKLPTLGYLNLILANLAATGKNPLNDITTGESKGSCNSNLPAIVGWDMGTGFGTPNYPKMLQILGSYNGTIY